jgi:hypothetical protein
MCAQGTSRVFNRAACSIFLIRISLFLPIQSCIVVTGVPTKSYRLPTAWIQPNTIVVNVASYKNVDEETLLKIPGVIYVPQVGKVTVAMLERNLMRLFDQFHHPDLIYRRHKLLVEKDTKEKFDTVQKYGTFFLALYTATAITVLIAMQLRK